MPTTIYGHLTWTAYGRKPLIDGGVARFLGKYPPATPHVHFSVPVRNPDALRFITRYGATKVDPYGWTGAGEDPWATRLEGALNQYLWLPGEAPSID